MGQKVNPIAFRTGVMIGWKSRWYASKQEFAGLLHEDFKIRNFIKKHPQKTQYRNAGIDRIEIERTRDEVKIILHVARPGLIIGKKGQEIELLQDELQNLIGRRVNLKIEEIHRPEVMAQLVSEEMPQKAVQFGSAQSMRPSLSLSRPSAHSDALSSAARVGVLAGVLLPQPLSEKLEASTAISKKRRLFMEFLPLLTRRRRALP